MKNLQIFALFLLLPLFFACEKEDTYIEPSSEMEVTYRFIERGAPELYVVKFRDENNQMQAVENPTTDWQYTMTVEAGFMARMELSGNIPTGGWVNAIIDGNGATGSWGANFLQAVPGDFSIENEYQIGDN